MRVLGKGWVKYFRTAKNRHQFDVNIGFRISVFKNVYIQSVMLIIWFKSYTKCEVDYIVLNVEITGNLWHFMPKILVYNDIFFENKKNKWIAHGSG